MQKLPNLTIIRFFAAFMVLCSHYALTTFQSISPYLTNLFCRGGEGVILFFVLSGFLMTIVYAERAEKGVNSKQFYVARFARIYPLYGLALILHAPMFVMFLKGSHPELLGSPVYLAQTVGMKFLMLDPYNMAFIQKSGWLLQGWSLGCELVFYALFPLFTRFIYKIPSRLIVPFTVGAWFASWAIHAIPLLIVGKTDITRWGVVDTFFQYVPPTRLLDFVFGIGLGLLVLKSLSFREVLAKHYLWVITATLVFQSWSSINETSESPNLLVLRLLYGLTIAALACKDMVAPPKESRLLRVGVVLGEISFAMYLYQGIVHDYLSVFVSRVLKKELGEFTVFLLTAVLLIAFCYFLHLKFEVPMRKWILERSKKKAAV